MNTYGRKFSISLLFIAAMLMTTQHAAAAVFVVSGPTTLVTSATAVPAASGQTGLFSFNLQQDAGETLSSVTVQLSQTGGSATAGSDIGSLSVYRDDGDGIFNGSDLVAGMQTSTIAMNATTTIPVSMNNGIASTTATSTKFFVTLGTGASWSDALPTDAILAILISNGIATSSTSPTSSAALTAALFADTTGPKLLSAVAKNTGGTSAKEPGDSIDFTFSEPTNKPMATSTNVMSLFSLNNAHSFLSASSTISSAAWNTAGTILTLILGGNASTTVASVTVGDTTSALTSSSITDAMGNHATGTVAIIGTFGSSEPSTPPPSHKKGKCANGLINGRLYRAQNNSKIYLAAGCRLKEFKGKAVGKAKGKKFRDILTLPSIEGLIKMKKVKEHQEPHESNNRNESDKKEKKSHNLTSTTTTRSENSHGKQNEKHSEKNNKGKSDQKKD